MKPEKLELSNLHDYPDNVGGIARAGEGDTLFCEVVSEDIRENAKEIVKRWNEYHALKSELAGCREWIKDVAETHLMVMNERCPSDEQHCTCVPVLRREIAELKANHRAGTETAIRIHAKQEAEIAELKRQIAETELIPFSVVEDWYFGHRGEFSEEELREDLQGFAKRKEVLTAYENPTKSKEIG